MGESITLKAADGHEFSAYRADPAAAPKGGLVVIQEIFGVNGHIREVCDGFAADGYAAIAPALFDRARPGVELGYDDEGVAQGLEIRGSLEWDAVLADVQAARDAVAPAGKVGIVGYCFGGTVTWLAATRLEFDGAVGYYGGQISQFADENPACPTMLHFGEMDAGIPLDSVAAIGAAHSDVSIHIYDGAGHGFSCDHRGSFDANAAAAARLRTLEFFAQNIGA